VIRLVNIAISGLGEIAFNHYRGITNTRTGRLAGVYSHSKDRADQIARQWNTKAYASFEIMVEDPELDAIVICSADRDHYRQAVAAMKGGKNVLVEKPLALTKEEVVDMARVSREENVILFPVHNYLFRPKVARAKELIRTGAIGNPCYAYFIVTQRMEEDVAKHYHGALFTQAYHPIYVSNFLLGTPVELQAMQSTLTFKELKSDDLFVSTLRYENGGIGNVIANWCANDISGSSWMWLDKVVGTEGVITISSFDGVSYKEKGSFMMSWAFDYQYSFIELMKHFVDEVLAGGQKPLQTPYDAIVVEDMMEKLRTSAATGAAVKYARPSSDGI
jgi:UDP-N-acetylglucosamine 3-dehydrogenase